MDKHNSETTLRWSTVKELFAQACELPPNEIEPWLADLKIDDRSIVDEVRDLLQSHAIVESSNYLDEPPILRPADPASKTEQVGSTVGPWILDTVLGEGGMGRVYRAHRADGQYERTVALKLLRSDRGSPKLDGFKREAEILARLEHPNIARLYDAGIDNDLPYLAIELVNGESIVAFARNKRLSVRDRISLFVQVTDAVAYAHRSLIVHRDIKPSNILVDADGNVSLLDFGIASVLRDDGTDRRTMVSNHALTLAYAAPEQVRQQPITTSTDVYSLGLVLYELLAERRAYEVSGKSVTEVDQTICDTIPPSPALVAENGAALRGDIESIVMKALEKSPDRRYVSASAFANDLRRYLSELPVEARRATAAYRFSKFVRRNRGYVAATFAIVAALIAGISGALWQARVAEAERDTAQRRFETAREMAGTALFDIHDAVSNLPGSTAVRELIIARSLNYLERLAADAGQDTQLRIDLALAYLRTGNVLGNPYNANLGHLESAMDSYDRGLEVLAEIETSESSIDSLIARTRLTRALINEKRADVFAASNQMDSVSVTLERARQLLAGLVADYPSNPGYIRALAISQLKRGDFLGNPNFPNAGDTGAAIRQYEMSLATLDRADLIEFGRNQSLRTRGVLHERLGVLYGATGRPAEQISNYERSYAIRKELVDQNPNHLNIYRDLGVAHEKLGLVLQNQKQFDKAKVELDAALTVFEQLAKADPENVQAQRSLAIECLHLAELMYSTQLPHMGDKSKSREYAARAIALIAPNGEVNEADETQVSLLEWANRVYSQTVTP